MHDFKYCIWACLDQEHPWNYYNFASKYGLHITIDSHLATLDTAITTFNDIIKNVNTIKIGLDAMNPVVCWEPDFNALYFRSYVIPWSQEPWWWPKDAHVSFSYSYGPRKLRGLNEVWYIQKSIFKHNTADINRIKLVRCTGDFDKHWFVIREHKIS
tara:strand:+ start:400 stop:870 length:471 start_codon:yes stop_codon:yes gene_type:complete